MCAGPFTWVCGQSIELENLLLTWNSAGANPDPCPAQNSQPCTPYFGSSKCRFVDGEGLTAFQASFSHSFDCPSPGGNYSVDFVSNIDGGTAPYTYTWDFGSGATPSSSSSSNQSNVSYSSPGLKTVTLTIVDDNNLSFVSTVMVDIKGEMAVNINNLDTINVCGNSPQLTANVSGGYAPYQYVWSNGLGSTMTVNPPSVSGTYTVTVTDSVGCMETGSIVVVIPSIVCSVSPASLTSDDCQSTICEGDGVNFTADPHYSTGTYSWTGPNSFTANGHEISLSNVASSASGNYTLTYDSGNGCIIDQVFELNVILEPTTTIGTDQIICVDDAPSVLQSTGPE